MSMMRVIRHRSQFVEVEVEVRRPSRSISHGIVYDSLKHLKGPGQESANQHRLNNKIQEIYELQICCIQ